MNEINKNICIDELVDSVVTLLKADRGKFYPNKNFGSLLKNIYKQPSLEYALAYARQAVDTLDGVFVKGVSEQDGQYIFSLIVNGEERQAAIKNENII